MGSQTVYEICPGQYVISYIGPDSKCVRWHDFDGEGQEKSNSIA